jgi:hypothetical protein
MFSTRPMTDPMRQKSWVLSRSTTSHWFLACFQPSPSSPLHWLAIPGRGYCGAANIFLGLVFLSYLREILNRAARSYRIRAHWIHCHSGIKRYEGTMPWARYPSRWHFNRYQYLQATGKTSPEPPNALAHEAVPSQVSEEQQVLSSRMESGTFVAEGLRHRFSALQCHRFASRVHPTQFEPLLTRKFIKLHLVVQHGLAWMSLWMEQHWSNVFIS